MGPTVTAIAAHYFTDREFTPSHAPSASPQSPRIDDRFYDLANDPTNPVRKKLATLISFTEFPVGWNNGEGRIISPLAINEATKFVQLFSQELNILVDVYPLNSGGVLIEGQLGKLDFNIDFATDGSAEISISRGDVVLEEGPIRSASSDGQRLVEQLFFAVR